MNHRSALAALIALAITLFAAVALHADWVVTRSGAKIRTRGPWKVQEDRVVFELGNGQLASLGQA